MERAFSHSKYAWFGLTALAVLLVDQASKELVLRHLEYKGAHVVLIPGMVDLVQAHNTGAALGLAADWEHRWWLFGVFTTVAMAVLGHMFWQLPRNDRLQSFALGMISAGALGNAIDRLRHQFVVDFVRLYTENATLKPWLVARFKTSEGPTFNVADVGIVGGLAIFAVVFLFLEDEAEKGKKPAEGEASGR